MANKTVYPYGTGGSLPSGIGIVNDMRTGGVYKALSAEVGKNIGQILGEYKVLASSFSGLEHYKDGYQLKADSSQIGKDIDEVPTYEESRYVNVKIPVDGIASVHFQKYGSTYDFGSLFIDENDVVVGGVTGPNREFVDVNVPSGSAYLVFSFNNVLDYDKTVTLYTDDGLIPMVKDLAAKEPSVNVTGKSPNLSAGSFDSSGVLRPGNFMTTDTIFGDFFLSLADGWRIYEGHLFDRSGKMVSYQIINPTVSHTGARGAWSDRVFMSNKNTVPDYGYRLTLCKSDQSAIADGENPVKNFVSLSDAGLHRWVPEDLPNYDRALRRLDYLQHLRWVPLAKVPNGYPPSSGTEYANTYFDLAGQVAIGVPYSDVAETRSYVPNNVSLRTFMTAVKNRRSVLYTEELNNNTSKYGRSYKNGNRRAYYGSVCCGLVTWVMGKKVMYLSSAFGQNTVPGLTTVSDATAYNVRPLDLIWNESHISIISDILKDEFGNVKYIVWAEMSTPYPYRTIYTPEQFGARLVEKSAVIHRWDGWGDIQEPEASEYSQYLLGDTRKEPEWSGDIMTFAGDYAAFAEGDTIYLNARRNSVYTGVELYKDDVLLQTIDITGLSADTIVTPNDEDCVAVNLTSLNLTYGKYKARLTDGENTTDYTHFEVVDVTLTATKSGTSMVVAFSSTEGTPVGLEKVKLNGFPNGASGYHEITAEEVAAGSITFTSGWGYNSTYKYIMILVDGDYGTVHKTVTIPQS